MRNHCLCCSGASGDTPIDLTAALNRKKPTGARKKNKVEVKTR